MGTRSGVIVRVPDANQIVVVDRKKRRVTAAWPMERFQASFPMALDEANHRFIIGGRKPGRLAVVDTVTGQVIGDAAMGGEVDDLFWDAARKRIHVSCGEGYVDIPGDAGNTFARMDRVVTRAGARTSFFAPTLARLYVPFPDRGAAARLNIYSVQ